jgi:hypothetical protein
MRLFVLLTLTMTVAAIPYDAVVAASQTSGCTPGFAHGHPYCLYPYRGVYSRQTDGGWDVQQSIGLNRVDTNADGDVVGQLRLVAASGSKAMLYFGYDKVTCKYMTAAPQTIVQTIANAGMLSAVGEYFLADEPHVSSCPNSPSQFAATTAAIRAIDPDAMDRPTMLVGYRQEDITAYDGTVDMLGLDDYPCHYEGPRKVCEFTDITNEASWVRTSRYRIVLQVFDDGYYALPTPADLHKEFMMMRKTDAEGYIVYAWHAGPDSSKWLENQPAVQKAIAAENGLA